MRQPSAHPVLSALIEGLALVAAGLVLTLLIAVARPAPTHDPMSPDLHWSAR